MGAPERTLDRVTADEKFLQALSALRDALDKTRVPWMFIGGVAVIAHGVLRQTQDIDATLWGPVIRPQELLPRLAIAGITPRPEHSTEMARRSHVLLMRHDPTAVDLDIAFSFLPFEREAIERATQDRFFLIFEASETAREEISDVVTRLSAVTLNEVAI